MRPSIAIALLILGSGHCMLAQSSRNSVDADEFLSAHVTINSAADTGQCGDAGSAITIQMHYAGTQPLRGYVVPVYLSGKSLSQPLAQPVLLAIVKSDPEAPAVKSNDTWNVTRCGTPKALAQSADVTARADLLKFADGSIAGPLALRESSEMAGVFDGIDLVQGSSSLEKFLTATPAERRLSSDANGSMKEHQPLIFTNLIEPDDSGANLAVVEATNEASIPVRGYVFTISFTDAGGSIVRRVTTKQLETRGDATHYLLPGDTWRSGGRKLSHSGDNSAVGFNVSLDVVAFADGSTWGPKNSRESDELLGILQGIDLASRKSHPAQSVAVVR